MQDQRQPGYRVVILKLPLGDLTADQARAVADIARQYTGDSMRTTADQNLVLRWVSTADLPAVHAALVTAKLHEPGANTITDITACPGTDTCKLGISSSRALAAELRHQLQEAGVDQDPSARELLIKTSGCFNSCGQHHVADLGFLGVSRNVNGRRVPHFQLVIGGQWKNNAGAYGLAIGAIPSKRVPEFTKRITAMFAKDRQPGENFQAFVNRIGKKTIRAMVEELQVLPSYEQDPSFYSDWADPREYTIEDMGEGECAGEVVPFVQMGLAAAEREIFEAQLLLDEGQLQPAADRAYSAMLQAARALARERNPNLGVQPDEVVADFRRFFFDTQLFFDPYAGRQVRDLVLPDPRRQGAGRRRRGRPPHHRGRAAVRGRRPPVLHPPGGLPGRPGRRCGCPGRDQRPRPHHLIGSRFTTWTPASFN